MCKDKNMYRFYRTVATLKKSNIHFPRIISQNTQSTLKYKVSDKKKYNISKYILYTGICMCTSGIVGYGIGSNIYLLETTR